jgi:hypothetical protein
LLSEEELKGLKSGKTEEIVEKPIDQVRKDWMVLAKIIILSILFYLAFLFSSDVFDPPSRRLCNLSFVLYHCSAVLAGMATGVF